MPRKPRKNQIDLGRHSTYHVITRCTRQQFLLGECDASRHQRKGVLLGQLQRLASFTAIGVSGFSVMDNHVHLLLKVDVELDKAWSAREVAERWLSLHPPRNGHYKVLEVDEGHIAAFCADAARVEACREKLMCLSQFMKELKQETTQQLNKLDGTVGSLWAGRFKCKAVKDEAELLATLAYVDLNPFAAGACELPEDGQHTSLEARLHGHRASDEDGAAKMEASKASGRTLNEALSERKGWWLPIGQTVARTQGEGLGLVDASAATTGRSRLGFRAYLNLLDATARLLRDGKKQLTSDMKSINQRLEVSPMQVAAQVRYWIDQGFDWAGLRPN